MFLYSANSRFGRFSGEAWLSYASWRGVQHVDEVVTMDSILCPLVLDELSVEDWDHNVHEDLSTHLFRDAAYLAQRVGFDPQKHNLMAISQDLKLPVPEGFALCGYDILDADISISVLLNCGDFSPIFATSELNTYGLLDNPERATAIAATIRQQNPDEPHCSDCQVWCIAKAKSTGGRAQGPSL